ncbi:MAG TPA: heavy metal translocating P-type ATPase [Bryobacteraceae bacterium]|nr:heavy metal translocating P-type ATPase [Bryobacteraceae bacterium]
MAIDPVCGMQVDPQNAAASQLAGKMYYFCCEGCKKKFEGRAAPVAASSAGEYTCPMHPEVRQKGPGACPKCGMALEPLEITGAEANPELEAMQRRFWISAALTIPLLVLMIFEMTGWAMPGARWVQLALATPVVLWGGWPFFERGWASVESRSLNMFTLIAAGTGTAYVFSVVAALMPQTIPASFRTQAGELPLYFEPAAVITTLVLLGQVLELRARAKTSSAIQSLLKLTPKTARLVTEGRERDVAIEQIQAGDRLRVRPGEHVPTDGVVVEGTSAVDESMMSGEAMPVVKAVGAQVTGGTLNGTGSFVMRAKRVGRDTLLSQMVRLVSEAQRTRAPIQRLADRVAGYFVPAVVICAAITFAVWATWGPAPRLGHALVNAIAVLIIACPCALGLATPMSIMVGTGRGATAGILVRNAEALEVLHRIDTLVVDKTGTLTEGKPKVVRIEVLDGFGENEILGLAASVERSSEHPLSGAIVAAAEERKIGLETAEGFQSVTGRGVKARVAGREVTVGNRALVDGAPAPESGAEPVVFVTIDGRMAGRIAVADPVKESAKEAIALLRRERVRVSMLTGDTRAAAEAVAKRLGIEDVEAGVLPGEKAEAVKKLRAAGQVVAMAGDGVNDAPALAAADVGIAMGTGTDVAMESAGVTLLGGDLRGVVRAVRLSRATMRNIRQNLFFAFVYNILGVPIAAGVLYPFFGILLSPAIASAAMTFSSVSVIANALRLRKVAL